MNGDVNIWDRSEQSFGWQGVKYPEYKGSSGGPLGDFVGNEHVPTLPDGSPDPDVTDADSDYNKSGGWDWGKVGGGFMKGITDPLGSVGALSGEAIKGLGIDKLLTLIVVVALGGIFVWTGSQALLKGSGA